MTKRKINKVLEYANKYKTKSKYGFNKDEIKEILNMFPNIDENSFNNALKGVTGILDNNDFIYYHYDIIKAIKCGLEKRKLTIFEWD